MTSAKKKLFQIVPEVNIYVCGKFHDHCVFVAKMAEGGHNVPPLPLPVFQGPKIPGRIGLNGGKKWLKKNLLMYLKSVKHTPK